MENPVRTADYFARRDTRLAQLQTFFADTLAGKTTLTLEIGCGHGHFLTSYAAAYPQAFCLGIDLLKDRIARATRKRDRARLPNLHFLQAEAHECLLALPTGVRLAQIFILFPDPWPKRRHHKNRILQPEFLRQLALHAQPEAHLYFRTDYGPYFSAAAAVVAEHTDWRLAPAAPWPHEYETVFQSRAPSHQSLVACRRHSLPPTHA